jgi:hypothetical protein
MAAADCIDGQCRPAQPPQSHPAVVRVVNEQRGSRSLGSGTLVVANDDYALVATCAHLFREGVGNVSVEWPRQGKRPATVAAMDTDHDLAVLKLSAVSVAPVPLAENPPRAGDWLTSCGYGPHGVFAVNRGRAAGYASLDGRTFDVLEMEGSARRGDSGGPIFNARGELAGVLFGTDGRRVNGSHCGQLRPLLQRCLASPPAKEGCRCDPNLGSRVARLEAAVENLANVAGGMSRVPEGAAPPSDEPSPPAAAAPPFDAAWNLLARLAPWLPWAAGLGVPSSLAAGMGWWLVRRLRQRARARIAAASHEIAETSTASHRPSPQAAAPRQREFVELRVPTQRLAALEQAMDEYVRRNPGARPTIETIEAYAKQYESSGKTSSTL